MRVVGVDASRGAWLAVALDDGRFAGSTLADDCRRSWRCTANARAVRSTSNRLSSRPMGARQDTAAVGSYSRGEAAYSHASYLAGCRGT